MNIATFRSSLGSRRAGIKLPLFQENSVHLALILLALISSLTLIYIKDLSRRLFIQYQKYENLYIKKVREHDQFVLEKTTWSTHKRIQMLASEKLRMTVPTYDQTIVIQVQAPKTNLLHASKQLAIPAL